MGVWRVLWHLPGCLVAAQGLYSAAQGQDMADMLHIRSICYISGWAGWGGQGLEDEVRGG